jgi:hypothetical protein
LVFFDYTVSGIDTADQDIAGFSGANRKEENVPLMLIINDEVVSPKLLSGQTFTSFRTSAADLVSLSHYVLSSKLGQDLEVEARYLIKGLP